MLVLRWYEFSFNVCLSGSMVLDLLQQKGDQLWLA